MKNKIKIGFTIGFLTLTLGGCKAPSLTNGEKPKLPESYNKKNITDSTTIAAISWKNFFPDKYLIEYIDSALANNYSFLQMIENVSIAREQARLAKGTLLPDISLGIDAGIQRFGEYTMDGVGNSTTNTPDLIKDKHIPDPYKNFNIGIRFQWEIDILGKLNDKRKAAVIRWMKTEEAKMFAQSALISEISTNYYELIGLDQKRIILQEEIEQTKEAYKLTNELMKEGEVSRLSVDQFLSRAYMLEDMLLATEQSIVEKEHALCVLIGKYPTTIKRSTFNEICKYSFPSKIGIPSGLLQNRPDIKAAELELIATKADLSAARKAFFPSLTIGGSGGFNAFNLSKWFLSPASLVYDLAAGLTAPIFKKNEIRVLWSQTKSRQKIALLEYHNTILKSYQEVSDLISASENLDKRKEIKAKESNIHHRSIQNANELFKTGFVGYLDVLSAAEKYLECELERIELNIEYCKMHTMLYRSLGGGIY